MAQRTVGFLRGAVPERAPKDPRWLAVSVSVGRLLCARDGETDGGFGDYGHSVLYISLFKNPQSNSAFG